jgi:predicted PurR-regulated permease PerM
MAEILSGVMILGMIIGSVKPSIDAFTRSKDIQEQIDEVVSTTDSLKTNFDKINANIDKIDLELQQEITDDLKSLQQIQAKINLATQDLNSSEKMIQMIGIIFVTIIFFILLIKEFDLLSFINKK